MRASVLNTIILGFAFLILFGIGEILRRKFGYKSEITRKISHVFSGFLAFLFPILINDIWLVLLLCISFAILLFVTKKTDFLNSIHDVERKSVGSYIYPASVFVSYLAFHLTKDYMFFYLPMFILAVCDPLAAVSGKMLKFGQYIVRGNVKTLAGNIAFFIGAFSGSVLLFFIIRDSFSISDFFTIISVALITTIVEAVTYRGWDNLTIPVSAIVVLYVFQLF